MDVKRTPSSPSPSLSKLPFPREALRALAFAGLTTAALFHVACSADDDEHESAAGLEQRASVAGAVNLAAGKVPTTSAGWSANLAYATDGNLNTSQYANIDPGPQWIRIDLGSAQSIGRVKLWHYFGDGRTYHDVIVQLSSTSDFSTATTIFNNDQNNSAGQGAGTASEYAETSAGKDLVLASPVTARYVRLWTNGSTANAANHYVEVEVYAPSTTTDAGTSGDTGTTADAGGGTSNGNVTVDFTSPVRPLSPLSLGAVDDGWGGGNVLANDTTMQQRVLASGAKHVRLMLKWLRFRDYTSTIVCSAPGCKGADGAAGFTGPDYVRVVKQSIGAEPVVVVNFYTASGAACSGTPNFDANVSAEMAAQLVRYFNVMNPALRVSRWIIDNEPNYNNYGGMHDGCYKMSGATYSQLFNVMYDRMKAVDPTIKIGGPGLGYYDTTFLGAFIAGSGSRIDILDFHNYGYDRATATVLKTESQLLAQTSDVFNNVNDARNRMPADRRASVDVQVGEWGHTLTGASEFSTVWGASMVGQMLKAGGFSLAFATKGGSESYDLLCTAAGQPSGCPSVDAVRPPYHGTGMYGGEGLFRGFGTELVATSTTLGNVEVYASNNAKNVVVINKDPSVSKNAVFSLRGVTNATAQVWKKDKTTSLYAMAVRVADATAANGQMTYTLPPYSVTTFVLP